MAKTHRNALVLTETGAISGLFLSSSNTTGASSAGNIRYVSGTGFVLRHTNAQIAVGDGGLWLYGGNTTTPATTGQINYVSGAGFVGNTQDGLISMGMHATQVTAQNDGTTVITGKVPAGVGLVDIVAASASAGVVYLPAPVAGAKVVMYCLATGCEIRSSNSTTIGIMGGTGAAVESAMAAGAMRVLHCVDYNTTGMTHNWIGYDITSGSGVALVEAAA